MEGKGKKDREIEEREMGLLQVDRGRKGFWREVTRMVLYLCVTPFLFLFLFFPGLVTSCPNGYCQMDNRYCYSKYSVLLGLQLGSANCQCY